MGICAITLNYVMAISPKATMKRRGWTQPQRGVVKLNVDVYFDHHLLRGTAGDILRDDKGKFIAGGIEELIGARMF